MVSATHDQISKSIASVIYNFIAQTSCSNNREGISVSQVGSMWIHVNIQEDFGHILRWKFL